MGEYTGRYILLGTSFPVSGSNLIPQISLPFPAYAFSPPREQRCCRLERRVRGVVATRRQRHVQRRCPLLAETTAFGSPYEQEQAEKIGGRCPRRHSLRSALRWTGSSPLALSPLYALRCCWPLSAPPFATPPRFHRPLLAATGNCRAQAHLR